MATEFDDLLKVVEERVETPLPAEVRAFLGSWFGAQFKRLFEEGNQARLEDGLVRMVRTLMMCGLWPGEDIQAVEFPEVPTGGKRDERWTLWRDLRDRLAEVRAVPYDEPPWTPFRFALDREYGYVVFSFDQRLPERAIKGTLKTQLPLLRKRDWLRETYYSPGKHDRGLALVRYVCVESPVSATWRERTAGWLASRYVREHPAWGKPYRGDQGPWRFEEDFHEAEAALAGYQVEFTTSAGERVKMQHPLALLYDKRVRKRFRQVQEMNDQAERALAGYRAAQEAEVAAVRQALGDDVAERLQRAFQADAEIEALVAEAKAGHEAAGEEAQRRVDRGDSHWTPEQLRDRLPKLAQERAAGEKPLDDFEAHERFIAERQAALREAIVAQLRERADGTCEASKSAAQLRCIRCGAWVPLRDSVLGHCLDCAHALAGE